jgi:integrase
MLRKINPRTAKVVALVERPGTSGEGTAATAALERIAGAALVERPAPRVIHLEDGVIKRLPVPASGHAIHWDDKIAGFGVRVTAAGSRAFIIAYRVKGTRQQRQVTIGRFPNWTTGAARTEAKDYRRKVDGGGDPRGDFAAERAAPTMADLADRFVKEHLPRKLRPATAESYKRALKLHIRPFFGKFKKVADVDFDDIEKLHFKVTAAGTPSEANRCVSVLSKMFSLSVKWKMRTAAAGNPAKGIERNPEVKRTRYMSIDELTRLLAALATHSSDRQFSDIVRMLILTGARSKSEVMAMRWADIDLSTGIWTKLGSTTKQRTDHVVSLSDAAREVLAGIHSGSEWVFPSDSKLGHITTIKTGWKSLCKAAGITGLRIHDVRHSFASFLVSGGASLELIGALLGHASTVTTQRYAHLFQDPQRAAAEKIGALVSEAGNGRGK